MLIPRPAATRARRGPSATGPLAAALLLLLIAVRPDAAQSDATAARPHDSPPPVAPGSLWNRGPDTPAGSTIELVGPGVHLPAVLEGLRGTRDSPIVVRRVAGGATVPFVVGGETGILVRDCEHLVIEELALIGATRRAIRIEDSRHIAIRNVLVARIGPDSAGDGIEIVGSEGIELGTIRFDGWQDAGLELVESCGVRGSDLQFTPLVRHRCRTAIRVGPGCRDVRLAEFSTLAIPIGLEVGTAADEATNASDDLAGDAVALPPSPTEVVLERARIDRPEIAIRLGDAIEVALRRITIVDPEFVLEIDAGCLESARFEQNLVVWNPGAMKAFAKAVRGDEGLDLGANLWWSAELPAARPLLGDLPGRETSPQRFSPDPKLDPRGHPTAPEATGFGRPGPAGS